MEFNELIKVRRSVRAYEDAVIDHDTLVKILKDAQMAPSWANRQTSRVYVLEDKETVNALKNKILPAGNVTKSDGAALLVTTFVKDVVGFRADGVPANDLGNYWGAYDLGLHDAYLVLAASNEGYDTLIMGIRYEDAIREELKIPENEVIVSVIALGKRAEEPAMQPRKEFEEVVKFI